MSGFSSAIAGLSSGLGSGLESYSQGVDDKLKYDTLMQQKKQAEELHNQQTTMNDQMIEKQNIALQQLHHNVAKQGVTIAKNNFAKATADVVSALSDAQGHMRVHNEDPKLGITSDSYTVPQPVTDAVNELNKNLRTMPETSDWINHFLDSKYGTLNNPVQSISYDAPSDQMIMHQANGEEIKMSPLLFNNALGLNQFQSIKQQKQAQAYAARSEALYKQANIGRLDNQNKVDIFKANTDRMRLKQDTIQMKLEFEQAKKKNYKIDQTAKLSDIHKLSYKMLNTPGLYKSDVKPIVDELNSDKTFTDGLTKNKLYQKVEQARYFSSQTKKYADELTELVDGAKTGSVDTISKMFLRYTGHTMNKEQLLKAKDLSTRLRLLTMDYLQYKSGAAFGAEELKGYEDAMGVMDFNAPDVAKAAIQGAAKYLKTRTNLSIEAVPNANEKITLRYKNGYYKDEPKVDNPDPKPDDISNILEGMPTEEDRLNYLRNLRDTNPKKYEEFKQKVMSNG